MRCWQARARVSDYLGGELDEAGVRALHAHPDPDSVVPAELAERISKRTGVFG